MPKSVDLDALARTLNIQEVVLNFKNAVNANQKLSQPIKDRLNTILASINTKQPGKTTWAQFFGYLYSEEKALGLANSRQSKEFKKILKQVNFTANSQSHTLYDLLRNKRLVAEMEAFHGEMARNRSELKYLIIFEYFYPLITALYKQEESEVGLVGTGSVLKLINEIIAEDNVLEILGKISSMVFDQNIEKSFSQGLMKCWRAIDAYLVVTQQGKIEAKRCLLQFKAWNLESQFVTGYKFSDSSTNSFNEAHLSSRDIFLENSQQFEAHWASLVEKYNNKYSRETNRKVKNVLIGKLNRLIQEIIEPYPFSNELKVLEIFTQTPDVCSAKVSLKDKLKKNYPSQSSENKIKILTGIVEYNNRHSIIDPFIQESILQLKNEGVSAEQIAPIISCHNQIVKDCQNRKRGPFRWISYWFNNEKNYYINENFKDVGDCIGLDEDVKATLKKYDDSEKVRQEVRNIFNGIIAKFNEDIKAIFDKVNDNQVLAILGLKKDDFYALELDNKINLIIEKQNKLAENQQGQWYQIVKLLKDYGSVKSKLDAEKEILSNKATEDVYIEILSKFSKFLLGATAVASDEVKVEEGNFGKAGIAINIGGKILPVPVISQIVSAIGAGVELYDVLRKTCNDRIISDIAPSYTRAEHIAELIAQAVTIRHKNILEGLAIESAGTKQFATDIYDKTLLLILDKQITVVKSDQVQTAANIVEALHKPLKLNNPIKTFFRTLSVKLFKALKFNKTEDFPDKASTTETILTQPQLVERKEQVKKRQSRVVDDEIASPYQPNKTSTFNIAQVVQNAEKAAKEAKNATKNTENRMQYLEKGFIAFQEENRVLRERITYLEKEVVAQKGLISQLTDGVQERPIALLESPSKRMKRTNNDNVQKSASPAVSPIKGRSPYRESRLSRKIQSPANSTPVRSKHKEPVKKLDFNDNEIKSENKIWIQKVIPACKEFVTTTKSFCEEMDNFVTSGLLLLKPIMEEGDYNELASTLTLPFSKFHWKNNGFLMLDALINEIEASGAGNNAGREEALNKFIDVMKKIVTSEGFYQHLQHLVDAAEATIPLLQKAHAYKFENTNSKIFNRTPSAYIEYILISPTQRIARYPLTIKEICNSLPAAADNKEFTDKVAKIVKRANDLVPKISLGPESLTDKILRKASKVFSSPKDLNSSSQSVLVVNSTPRKNKRTFGLRKRTLFYANARQGYSTPEPSTPAATAKKLQFGSSS